MPILHYLVGGIPTPLKNMKVSWDDEIPNMWKKLKKFQSPPTSYESSTFPEGLAGSSDGQKAESSRSRQTGCR